MGFYFDELGIKTLIGPISDEDQRVTETVNSSRTVAALEHQNALYEKEIKNTKRLGIATLILSGLSFLISLANFILGIIRP